MKSFAILVSLALAFSANAQLVRVDTKSGGYGTDSPYSKLYDLGTQMRFKGKVVGKIVSPPHDKMAKLVTLFIRSFTTSAKTVKGKEVISYHFGKTWPVEVGPKWYVDQQTTKVNLHDYVEVTGSKVTLDGRPTIMAKFIRKRISVLALRRPGGEPYWYAFMPTYENQNLTNFVPEDNSQPTKKIEQQEGQIVGITTRQIPVGNGTYVQESLFVIRTADGSEFTSDVAPSWYYNRQDYQFQVGQNVVVTGTTDPDYYGGPVLLVYGIKAVGTSGVTVMRDANGRPVWSP